ncbi:diguanylate cyclase [Myxococcota bacterium]|nr:diguanylate cyclase [Myxococcota bacterium]
MRPDLSHPIALAPRVWWVGHVQEGDPFQCHAYLVEQGDQSVLIDPGSMRTWEKTRAKIEQVVAMDQVRYFVAQHQDPDIVAALPHILATWRRPDARVVTHWRSAMLLQHYDLPVPFWLVDQHDWSLRLEDRVLHFVFTPYAHFAGAIATYDPQARVLFSSDLFGAIDDDFHLFAEDESHFDRMRSFHEHYMPSRDILDYSLATLARLPFQTIAPQHGSILREPLARTLLERLRHLDCGLYLLADRDTDILRLSRLNATLREITQAMSLVRDFQDIAGRLLEVIQRSLPVTSLRLLARDAGGQAVCFRPETRFRGERADAGHPDAWALGLDASGWARRHGPGGPVLDTRFAIERSPGGLRVVLPLFTPERGTIAAVASLDMSEDPDDLEALGLIVEQLALPLHIAVEREMVLREVDQRRQEVYERSIRDPLTGLFTRVYMHDAVDRLFQLQDRGTGGDVGVALLDIDHFKRVNDTWGHVQGDAVLRRVGQAVRDRARAGDLPIRLGGEEIAVFAVGLDPQGLAALAERLRAEVQALVLDGPLQDQRVTVSIGTTLRRPGEALEVVIDRADAALYAAKRGGRNQVVAG